MKGRFRIKDDLVYKMPVHFGGDPFYPVRTVYGDMTCISISFETDEELLLDIIPEDFELLSPTVNIQFANCRDIDWMSGGEYRLIQAGAPVRYTGRGGPLEGEYVLVIWENKACPIIGGREEDGMPKIFADIAQERHSGDNWFTAASYESNTFLRLNFMKGRKLQENEIRQINEAPLTNNFGWRYIPELGRAGAALSHPTLYPQEMRVDKAWEGGGRVEWLKFEPEMNMIQYRIISQMSGLPILRYVRAVMLRGSSRLNVGDSKSLI